MKHRIFAAILSIAAILFMTSSVMASDPIPGWNGDVKIHEGAGEPDPVTKDEPKVCTFHLHGFNFDSQENVDWWIIKGQPFDTLPVRTGKTVTTTDGAYVSTVYSLSEDTYKLFWAGQQAGGAKHKVFKVSCQPTETESPSGSLSPSVEPSPSFASATPTPMSSDSPSPSMSPSFEPSPTGSTGTGQPSLTPPPSDAVMASSTGSVIAGFLFGVGVMLVIAAVILAKFGNSSRPRY